MSARPPHASARAALSACASGVFPGPSGTPVSLREELAAAVRATVLWRPKDVDVLGKGIRTKSSGASSTATLIEVTPEKAQDAAIRVEGETGWRGLTGVLNFASAKHPGGGFLNGARAQEEDLCRCSGLFKCLEPVHEYYETNLRCGHNAYTHHLIFSPRVPFFCRSDGQTLDKPCLVSVVTSPAPNHVAITQGFDAEEYNKLFQERVGHVLGVFHANGVKNLVLGAWGCGVFHNDPAIVADLFATWLAGKYSGAFERVVFAVYDPSPERPNWRAFQRRFASAAAC